MDSKLSSVNDGNAARNELPPVGKRTSILHDGRPRTAYRDSDGNWRDYYDGNVLRGKVQIVKVG